MNSKTYDGFTDSFDADGARADAAHRPEDLEDGGVPADGSSLESRSEDNDHDRDGRANTDEPKRERHAKVSAEPPVEQRRGEKKSSTTAGLWIALILGALLLILLLVFVVQNNTPAVFNYFQWSFNLPLGAAMLCAAVAGALIMALVGSVRIMQLKWQVRKYRKQQEKLQNTLRR